MNSIHNICYTCDTNHILKSTCLNQVIVYRLSHKFYVIKIFKHSILHVEKDTNSLSVKI